MKKTLLSSMIVASLTTFGLVGCIQSDTQTTIDTVNASSVMMLDSVQSLTRNDLLATDRLATVDGATIKEQSQAQVEALKQQLENAVDGSTITIAAGKYSHLDVVNITANNITIKAEQPGSVWLTGLVQLNLEGNGITVDGLVFTEGGPAERFGGVRLMGDQNTLQNSTFYYFNHDYEYLPDERRAEYPKYLWVSLWGKEGQLLNNRFEGKQKRGTLIGVQKDETPDNHLIANNLFLDQKPNQFNEFDIKEAIRYNGNSWEAIRVGDSKASQYRSNTKITNNLMIDMDGERELISIKSGGNEISSNTIFESSGLISLRHGKANTVKDNVILGNEKRLTGGMRIYDEDHVIENNYIDGTRGRDGEIEGNADLRGGIVINTGIIDVANNEVLDQDVKGKELNKQWTPKNITIRNNTLTDTEWGIVYGNQTHRVSLFNNDEVGTIFAGVGIHFDSNMVDNHDNPDFVSVRATQELPLVDTSYSNEVYVGTVTQSEQISDYSTVLPTKTSVNGFNQYQGVGADVDALSIVTADTAGPDYELINTNK
ncbi:polysaccharide lyase 6 family protein [Vibrio ulleungensis]|uniref:Polysaccharide lyase 6 family protein n=1 Tax=Vibrio ulleungensis TaxID=2807619 RepID=A0ABS2HKL3_9VIBR|nr:polysaccharide lyase 6 family protein [Vibrio ulleungensis]MBM7036614.1 polysaccharide lyase 6 family protein [Vibrio ulleungensis]